jgi:hypothetical protein
MWTSKRVSREVSFQAFSSTDQGDNEQYPNQASTPRREGNGPEGRSGIRKERSNVNSFDTAIHVPSITCEGVDDDRSDEFLDRYNSRRDTVYSNGPTIQVKSSHSSGSEPYNSPTLWGIDDESAAPPADFGNHRAFPLRSRYGAFGVKWESIGVLTFVA